MQKRIAVGLGGGVLIQVANRTLTQMMSYIVDLPDGGIVVVDGGNYCPEDARNLYNMIESRGKEVRLWIITHAHSDHFGALLWLLENMDFDLKIQKLCYKFPKFEWLYKIDSNEAELAERFVEAVRKNEIETVIPTVGDIYSDLGGVNIEIISTPEKYEHYPNINSTSIIFIIHFLARDVLITGDFDVYAQKDFIDNCDVSKLRCDIVQMSHHGQGGVDHDFYELIKPKICLYCAPQWLWENNHYKCTDPKTAGQGPFTIMETRRWMEEMGVEASYTHADGDCYFY